jgi:hypothetical protein
MPKNDFGLSGLLPTEMQIIFLKKDPVQKNPSRSNLVLMLVSRKLQR